MRESEALTSSQHGHENDAAGPDVGWLGVVLVLGEDLRGYVGQRAAPPPEQPLLA